MNLLNWKQHRRYKGNLHLHTTNSDGRLSPAEAAAWYRRHGYDFVAFTDHNKLTTGNGLADGLLAITGSELAVDNTELGQTYHLVVLGLPSSITYAEPRLMPVQAAIDDLNRRGALVILAHPYWSGLTVADMLPLQGILGIEIYNTSANRDLGKALATVHWDDVLVRGKRWWGVAVDDSHWIDDDAGGGWVMVEADVLAEDAILAALQAGRFYASTGPDINSLDFDGTTLMVTCSPVSVINVIGHTQYGEQWRAEPGKALTEASYRVQGKEKYLRVECIDAQGRTAWSNPIYL